MVSSNRPYKFTIEVDDRGGSVKATILDFDQAFTAATEEEVIKMCEDWVREAKLPERFLWCVSCRRYEARGTSEHIARRGRRRKKQVPIGEEVSVEDELIAGAEDEI